MFAYISDVEYWQCGFGLPESAILDNEIIVGYSVEGKPLTKKEYNKRLEKAEAQIASGKFLTQEEKFMLN